MAQPQTQEDRIRLYSGDFCPYCRRVKKELDRLELPYEEVYADADGREEVVRLSGQRAIPILTIGRDPDEARPAVWTPRTSSASFASASRKPFA